MWATGGAKMGIRKIGRHAYDTKMSFGVVVPSSVQVVPPSSDFRPTAVAQF